MPRSEKRTESVEGTERLGANLARVLREGDVVALSGPLGAGKTRFVSGLVRALSPGARVRSPSFTLVNEFPATPSVFHLDLYRLDGTRDIEGLGLEDYAERGALVVEWGEKLGARWLAEALTITIAPEGDERRRLHGAAPRATRAAALLARWAAAARRGSGPA